MPNCMPTEGDTWVWSRACAADVSVCAGSRLPIDGLSMDDQRSNVRVFGDFGIFEVGTELHGERAVDGSSLIEAPTSASEQIDASSEKLLPSLSPSSPLHPRLSPDSEAPKLPKSPTLLGPGVRSGPNADKGQFGSGAPTCPERRE